MEEFVSQLSQNVQQPICRSERRNQWREGETRRCERAYLLLTSVQAVCDDEIVDVAPMGYAEVEVTNARLQLLQTRELLSPRPVEHHSLDSWTGQMLKPLGLVHSNWGRNVQRGRG